MVDTSVSAWQKLGTPAIHFTGPASRRHFRICFPATAQPAASTLLATTLQYLCDRMPTTLLYDGWTDAWGEVDHSGDPNSGRIGCMVRWMSHLDKRAAELNAELAFIRESRERALAALDRFAAASQQGTSAPVKAGE